MNDVAQLAAGRSSPGLRYRNVNAAIDWLSEAFGFEVLTVETDVDGCATYAELSFGSTIIMVGAIAGFDIDRFMTQPDTIGGVETQCSYYVVDDIDAHYLKARRAGCEVVIDLQTRPNGARAYTCRDPEGHLWSFGTYDPWRTAANSGRLPALARQSSPMASEPAAPVHSAMRFPARLAAGLSMGAIVSGIVAAWIYGDAWQTSREAVAAPSPLLGGERVLGPQFTNEAFQQAIKDARRRVAYERRIRRLAERASKAAQAAAAEERSLRLSAEQTIRELAERLESAQHAVVVAQNAVTAAESSLAKERASKPVELERLAREAKEATRAAAKVRAELAVLEKAKAAAEQEARTTRARLTFVSHNVRESSEQAIAALRKQMVDEKSAREAAERQAQVARDELARERSLKIAALNTVDQLQRRLAAIGGTRQAPKVAKQTRLKRAVAARRRAKAVARARPAQARTAAATPAPAAPSEKGWSLYGGPAFYKGDPY